MTGIHALALASFGVVLCAQSVDAEAPFGYREYELGSSVASVARISRTRVEGVKTLHERPARIQEIVWRAPYVPSGAELADPVRDVLFSFHDDQLYQVVVTYERDRMEGLTNDDVIEAISATYGVPLLRHARITERDMPPDIRGDTMRVAQWEDTASLLTLTRGTYSQQYQLVLISKTLNSSARAAIQEALRLDTQEAPQRERDQRSKEAADVRVASQKARVVNKAAFKP